MWRRSRALLAVLLLLATLGGLTFTRLVDLRTDMAAFLPPGSTPAARFLIRELQSGAAASLLLVAIDDAPPPELTRISREMTAALAAAPGFSFVTNGAQGLDGGEEAFLFAHRYLLSPATAAAAFEPEALRGRLQDLLVQLAGSAQPLVERYGFSDPIGALFALVPAWLGGGSVETSDGVWFSGDGSRALLLARSAAGSLDVEAQRRSIAAVEAAFAASEPGAARLIVSGPGVFAVRSADAIEADVRFVAILSTVLIASLLLLRYRSLHVLAVTAVPLVSGSIAAALVVQLVFGFVHGITLGFGMTMLGVVDDYPLLLLGQRRPGEAAVVTARRIAPTLAVAVAAAALGVMGMLLSSFPGLSQLGLFAATGLVVAAAVTRWVLPRLVTHVSTRDQAVPPAVAVGLEGLRRNRAVVALLVVSAAGFLVAGGGPRFETDLANLGPIPAAERDLDGELRRQVGAPDVRHLVAITAADEEGVLRASERLGVALDRLQAAGAIGGADLPSRLLPSATTQRARRAILPSPDVLERRLAEAARDLPFRPDAFAPFIADVVAQRSMAPVTSADFTAPALDARLDPVLGRTADGWFGLAALRDVADPAAVAAAVAALDDPALAYVDIKAETESMLTGYLDETLTWLGIGAAVLMAALAVALRRPVAILRVTAPIAGALVVTLAVLAALDVPLTMFHLAALLLMAGVTIDYGLFLSRAIGRADRTRALGAVLDCNATTLLTFGLLVFCQNPVLRGIGATVAIGAVAAIVCAIAFALPPEADDAPA